MFSPQVLIPFLSQFSPSSTFWIAYSGGVDSHVLLTAITKLRHNFPETKIKAIHINHGLSPNAEHWQKHCTAICNNLSIELKNFSIAIKADKGESLEEVARKARYKIFKELLVENDCLITAHHQDDQAETVLLQLLRGAGPKGLSAIPAVKALGKGFLLRPLLNFPRAELLDYAEQEKLNWIEDESNLMLNFNRNYIRKQIMPLIKVRWPQAGKTLQRAAKQCAFSVTIDDEIAKQDLVDIQGKQKNNITISKLLYYSEARRNNVIRYWLQQLQLPLPHEIHLQKIMQNVLHSSIDAQPLLTWQGVEIRRYRDDLYAMPPITQNDDKVILQLNLPTLSENLLNQTEAISLELPNNLGTLLATPSKSKELRILPKQIVDIRFRRGGEKIQPYGRKETHELKKLFQEWGVPPWLRNHIPLLYCANNLVAVVGYCVEHSFVVSEEKLGWVFRVC
jgi:tRNA(Ile)-lysidine synthase